MKQSAELLAANNQLFELRESHAKQAQTAVNGRSANVAPVSSAADIFPASPPTLPPSEAVVSPSFLKWNIKAAASGIVSPQKGSQELTNGQKGLQQARQRAGVRTRAYSEPDLTWLDDLKQKLASDTELEETAVTAFRQKCPLTAVSSVSVPLPIDGRSDVKVWPALASALHKADYAPHNRLYLASQLLDPERSGRIDVPLLRAKFTDKSNGRYLFGWRRMRQVLGSGDGRLWDWNRKTDQVHLHGPRRIAETLDLERVDRAVMVPMSVLFNGQGEFNAHMHAAWLASHGDENKPISQAAIEDATAVPGRTQRHYNKLAGIHKQTNLEIGEKHTALSEEETVWQNGRNSFEFVDYQGRQGKPDGRYRARRLPNSYRRRHRLAAKGRRRKINRGLARLVNMETRGSSSSPLIKLYHTNGRSAVQAHSKRPDIPAYWPESGRAGTFAIWHVLS